MNSRIPCASSRPPSASCGAQDATLLERRTGQGEYAPRPPGSYHIYFWTIGQNLSPVQVAAQFGHGDALEVIHTFASPKQRLLEACASADADGARRLLRAHPELVRDLTPADQRALADAAWAGEAPAVELMMDLDFDPAARGHDGGTALHCAAWGGSAACVRAILRHERGIRLVNDRDPHYDATPLGWCLHGAMHCDNSRTEHVAVARVLLEAGAEPPADTGDLTGAMRKVIRDHAS